MDSKPKSSPSIPSIYNSGNLVFITDNIAGGSMNNLITISANEVQKTERDVVGVKCGVPEVLEKIIGRDDIISELKLRVLRDKCVTIVGMAGIGKTLTALSCVNEWVPGTFQTALLIQMDSEVVVMRSLISFLNHIRVAGNCSILENVKSVYNFFKNNNCLVVLDNIEMNNRQLDFIWTEAEGRNVYILGTSQFSESKNPFRLEKLSVGCALSLLREELKGCRHDSVRDGSDERLVEVLDCHPLAIKMAAALIKDIRQYEKQSYSVLDYTNEYQKRFDDPKPFDSTINYDKTVYTAVVLNIEKIKRNNTDGYKLLSLLTFLNPANITKGHLNCFDLTDVNKTIRLLKKHSIIQNTGRSSNQIIIHRLFQIINHELLKNDAQCGLYKQKLFKICFADSLLYFHRQHILKYFESEREIRLSYRITYPECRNDWTSYNYAMYCQDWDVIKRLVELDAPISEVTDKGWSIMHSLTSIKEFDNRNLFLLNHIESLRKIPKNSVNSAITLLFNHVHTYSLHQFLFIIDVFLSLCNDKKLKKAIIECKLEEVLSFVIEMQFDNIFELLLDKKIDLNSHLGMKKCTLLTWAFRCNNMRASKRLIELGADVNQRDASGASPLFAAIRNKQSDLELIEYLITHSEYEILRELSSLHKKNILYQAITSDAVDVVRCVLKVLQERDLHGFFKTDEHGNDPIHEAVKRGNLDIIQLVVFERYDFLTNDEENIFHIAAKYNNPAVIYLLAEIVKSDGKSIKDYLKWADIEGRTPLLAAVAGLFRSLEVVEVLTNLHADHNAVDLHGNTIFHYAVQSNDPNIFKYLVETSKGEPNTLKELLDKKNNKGRTLLHVAAENYNGLELVKLLIEHHKVDRRVVDYEGNTVLHSAVQFAKINTVKYLIDLDISECNVDKNPFFDQRNNQGQTILHLALTRNGLDEDEDHILDLVMLLIEYCNVDRNVIDHEGNTVLHLAVGRYYLNIVNYFIENSEQEPNNSLKLFLERRNSQGQTLLHLAAMYEDDVLVKLLIEDHNVDRNVTDNEGNTVWHLAATHYFPTLIVYLIGLEIADRELNEKNEFLNLENNNGDTPLHIAAFCGNLRTIRILIEYGADDARKNNNNQTPSDVARLQNHVSVVDYFDNFKRSETYSCNVL